MERFSALMSSPASSLERVEWLRNPMSEAASLTVSFSAQRHWEITRLRFIQDYCSTL